MKIEEIMTTTFATVRSNLTIQEAARKMRDRNIDCLVVIEGGEPIGIVTDRDLCCRAVADRIDPSRATVREFMTSKVAFCFGDQDIVDGAHLMEKQHIRRLAVLDRANRMLGLVSVDDIARCSYFLAGQILERSAVTAH